VSDGHITGDLYLWSYLDKSQCLMDTSLGIYVFEVIWTKGSVWWTNHWRFVPLQLLVQKTGSYLLFIGHDADTCLSCLKSFRQTIHVLIFKHLIPTNPFNAACGRPVFCVKILGRNTRCRKVVFVRVNADVTCEFWGFRQSCALMCSTAAHHCVISCRRFGRTYYSRNTENQWPYDMALYPRKADISGGTYPNHRALKR